MLVVSYGVGVDSTAMLVGMHQRGIRPDAILFADTGGEKPETYAYLPIISAWLAKVGFPAITIVRYAPVRATYTTLEGKCLTNEALPSLAYGGHTCATVFKIAPQEKYLSSHPMALEVWARREKVVKAIGYDNGKQDCRRRLKADKAVEKMAAQNDRSAARYQNWYPLQEWGIDREGCLALIASAGIPCPPKSACWFCPASTKREVVALREQHPDLYDRAIAMEERAFAGRNGPAAMAARGKRQSVKGLGRRFAWASLAETSEEDLGEEGPETLRP